ncbi:MAG: right-handed parallel beta-helix repeat-containing protein [Bacteroidales bacterium]
MRKIISFVLLSFSLISSATNYYVSSSGGNDANNGKSTGAAWKTITKVNAMMNTFVAKDSILFKCGDTFTDQFNITKSGTSSSPIVYASYGSGAKPLLNTAVTLTGWTVTSNPNIWVANYTGALSDIRFVTINDKIQQIGRFPDISAANDGFLYNDACWGFNKFRDASVNVSTQDWTGATAVMYTKPYRIEGVKILKHQLDTITTNPTTAAIHVGYGYIIQNHLATLTTQGEWYFDRAAKKVYLYSTTNPSLVKVQASSTKYGILINSGITGINIKNFAFRNADTMAVSITSGSYINIDNCTFSNTLHGVWMASSTNISVTNNSFTDIYNISIGSTYSSLYITATNNYIRRNFLNPGMSDITNNAYKAAISLYCTSAVISYNDIDSCGYIGVYYNGYGNTISHNKIGHFNMRMFDGGGIYSFGTWSYVPSLGTNKYGNNLIENNYIYEGIGYLLGTNEGDSYNRRPGIYNDALTEYNTVRKNVCYNTHGILLASNHHHTAIENTIYNSDAFNTAHPDKLTISMDPSSAFQTITKNTFYNSTFKIVFNPYNGFSVGRAKDTIPPMTNQGHRVTQNIFYSSRNIRQPAVSFTYGFKNYARLFGVMDSNYYWQPFALDTIVSSVADSGYVKTRRLAYGVNQWKSAFEPHGVFKYSEYPATFGSPGTNLFASNSTFTSNISGWFYDNENVTSQGSWVSSGGLDGGCALLDLTSASASASVLSSVRFYRMIGTVNEGDTYLLNFSAISNSNSAKLCINFTNTTGSSPKTYTTSTIRRDYSIPITFNDNGGGTGQYLYFTLHDKGAKVWLDNISVQKVSVSQVTPAEAERFEVNTTETTKLVNLGTKTYKDVTGTIYSGTLSLEPYTSKILIQYTPPLATNIVMNSKQSLEILSVFPSTNRNNQPIKMIIQSLRQTEATMRISSANGNQLYCQKMVLNEGLNDAVVPALIKGAYVIEVTTVNGTRCVKKFIQ